MASPFNREAADPTGLRLAYHRYNGKWYLEWYPNTSTRNRAPIQRRIAHDVEIVLLKRIAELEKQVRLLDKSAIKHTTDLGLKQLVGLKTLQLKRITKP